jgi:hypothetical protein
VYVTSAWDEFQQVTATGYNNGVAVGSITINVNNDGPTLLDVNWGPIDQLNIDHSGTWLVFDNFHLT